MSMILESGSRGRAGGFFAHHGIWAPGVRAFRTLRFSAKACIISFAFVLPLGVLAWSYFSSVGALMQLTQRERVGVTFVAAANTLLDAVQAQRLVASGSRVPLASPGELDAAWARLEGVVQDNRAALDLSRPVAAARDAHEALKARASGTAAELEPVYQNYIDAVVEGVGAAADASGLTRDPDVDTYFLMNASTRVIPQVIEHLGHMRSLLARALVDDKVLNEASRRIGAYSYLARRHLGEIGGDMVKVMAATPEVAHAVQYEEAVAQARKALDLSEAIVLNAAIGQETAAFSALSTAASTQLIDLRQASLGELDRLLQVRLDQSARERLAVACMLVVMLTLACYLFHSFYRVMEGGLKETRRHLQAMTAGDLTPSPSPWGDDEAARIMFELRNMQQALRSMVMRVRSSSDEIVNSSDEIATGAMDLSARTEQAASNLQQSAASMEQIAATVRNTSDHTDEASKVAHRNADFAATGGNVMRDVVATMDQIRSSSAKIAEINSTIDGIAFQTNILALNAAVEAARAGTHGLGFAVVASEVRMLAQRSAEAAKAIKALIGGSVEQVEIGTDVVRKAGTTMQEIVSSSDRVNQLLRDISSGAREQAVGIGQIGQAVQDLDHMTQQNAALVEHTAAAASAMKHQARALAQEVARFKLPAGVQA